ncbi:MAG: four helix bundle protein [Ignavibacteriaceae bacterium]
MKAKYIETNKNINRGYRKLDVWKEAIELFTIVRKKMKTDKDVPFKIKGQIQDAVFSVSSNIAEGYCRRSIKENIQFNTIALASLGESYTQIFALFNSDDVSEDWFNEFDSMHYCLENKLVSLNKSFIQKLNLNEKWNNDYQVKEIIEAYNS